MPGRGNLGRRHGSPRPAGIGDPRRHAHHPRRHRRRRHRRRGPTTSWSSAPAPAAWPPPCPRPATARACSSSTAGPAPRASPAPPGSTCAPMEILRTWGVARAVRARRHPRRPRGRLGDHPRRAARARAAARAATRPCARSSTSAPCCRWPARRTCSNRSSSTPCAGGRGDPVRDPARRACASGPTASVPTLGLRRPARRARPVRRRRRRHAQHRPRGARHRDRGTWAPGPTPSRCCSGRTAAAARAAPRSSPSSTSRTPRRCARWARAAGPTCACGSTAPGRPSPPTGRRRCGPPPGFPTSSPRSSTCSRFTLAAEVATAYRAGPGFLVGDAAHRTTPVGRDRPEHRGPRRPRAGLEARVGGARPGRGGAAREPRRRARPRRAGRRRALARRGGPPDRRAGRAAWATRTARR